MMRYTDATDHAPADVAREIAARKAIAARDAEWRAAVAEMRSVYTNVPESDYATGWHEACDTIVRVMEAK